MYKCVIYNLRTFLSSTKLGNANAGEPGPVNVSAENPWVTTILAVSIPIAFILLVIALAIVVCWRCNHRPTKAPQQNEHLADPVQDTQTAQPQHTLV